MRTERQQKIELLVRRNQAQREHPYYLTELSHVLKQPLPEAALFDLETTDNLVSQYHSNGNLKEAFKRTWPFDPNSRWIRICFCLAEKVGSEPVALFAGPFEVCGAVRTEAHYPLVNALSVLGFDGDTVRIHSVSSDGGLYLDLYEENAKRWIELKVWGKWYGSAKTCFDQVEGKA
jgi:hypothetical protein